VVAWPDNVGTGYRLNSWDAIRKIDVLGNVLVLAASTLLVFSLQQVGGFHYQWHSPTIIGTLSVASLSWAAFFTWELYLGVKQVSNVEPILPLRLITRRVYLASLM
jgi:hypothetical protein